MSAQMPYDELIKITETQEIIRSKLQEFDANTHAHWRVLLYQLESLHTIRSDSNKDLNIRDLLDKIQELCVETTSIGRIGNLTNEIIATRVTCMIDHNCREFYERQKIQSNMLDDFFKEKKEEINQKINTTIEKSPISSFEGEAKKHKTASTFWLLMSGLTIVALFCGLIFLYCNQIFIDSSNKDVALYVFMTEMSKKIIFTAIMLFLFGICIKQFKINRHMYTLNKSKEHAYTTYINMIGTAKRDENMTSLKQEISKCIFAIQPSGYLGGDDGDMKALEILKYIDIKQKIS